MHTIKQSSRALPDIVTLLTESQRKRTWKNFKWSGNPTLALLLYAVAEIWRINDEWNSDGKKFHRTRVQRGWIFVAIFSTKPKGNFSSFQWTRVAWATEITRNNGSLCSNNVGLCSNNGRLSSSNCGLISTSSSRLRTVYAVEKR